MQEDSIQCTTARRNSSRVDQRCRVSTFFCKSELNDPLAALSPAGADSTHRPDEAVSLESGDEGPPYFDWLDGHLLITKNRITLRELAISCTPPSTTATVADD